MLLKKPVVWQKKTPVYGLSKRKRKVKRIRAIITSPLLSMRVRPKTKTTVKLKLVVAVLALRQKLPVLRRKATSTLNPKLTVKKHVLLDAVVKAASVKVLLYSRASRSQRKPLTVTL
ncbi:hypothetical protein D3C75_1033000 [compost metagenome]